MNRTAFLIDGFNLYHSLRAASSELGGATTKWLDIRGLLESYLYVIGGAAQTQDIFCFSALATHLEKRQPGITIRHRDYIDCLQARGIVAVLGRFKSKYVYCSICRQRCRHFEEKETDVAISVKLLELLHLDLADTITLVTGDTDLAPAIRVAKALFPTKRIWVLFPYKRKNKELAQLSDGHCHIGKARYTQYQLPSDVTLPTGRVVQKPASW